MLKKVLFVIHRTALLFTAPGVVGGLYCRYHGYYGKDEFEEIPQLLDSEITNLEKRKVLCDAVKDLYTLNVPALSKLYDENIFKKTCIHEGTIKKLFGVCEIYRSFKLDALTLGELDLRKFEPAHYEDKIVISYERIYRRKYDWELRGNRFGKLIINLENANENTTRISSISNKLDTCIILSEENCPKNFLKLANVYGQLVTKFLLQFYLPLNVKFIKLADRVMQKVS